MHVSLPLKPFLCTWICFLPLRGTQGCGPFAPIHSQGQLFPKITVSFQTSVLQRAQPNPQLLTPIFLPQLARQEPGFSISRFHFLQTHVFPLRFEAEGKLAVPVTTFYYPHKSREAEVEFPPIPPLGTSTAPQEDSRAPGEPTVVLLSLSGL